MNGTITSAPRQSYMVTEACSVSDSLMHHKNCTDLLCIECGWEGHAHFPTAAWPAFRTHKCKLRAESWSRD